MPADALVTLGAMQCISWQGNDSQKPKYYISSISRVNTFRPRQDGPHFPNDTFNRIFMNKNVRISIEFSLKFVPKRPINNIPSLVQIMAWRRPGDKPLSEPMMVSLLAHICVTRPQWAKNTIYMKRKFGSVSDIIYTCILSCVYTFVHTHIYKLYAWIYMLNNDTKFCTTQSWKTHNNVLFE